MPVLDDVVRRHVAEPLGHVVEGGARADDGDEVVVADRLGAGRHDRRVRGVGVLEARDADLVVVGAGEHRHGHRLVDLDAHGDVADLLATRLRARAAQRPGRDDEHDDDATEVGDRVADRGRRGVGRAGRGRRERGGVGQRTGVGAGDGARLEAERAPDDDGDAADQGERTGDDEHRGPAAAQRGEEVGARHDADRVREQHQAEGADHLGDLEVDPGGRGPGGDAERGEQHGGRAEAHPGDPHVADGRAEHQQDREEEERILGKGLEQGGHVHDLSTLSTARNDSAVPRAPARARTAWGPASAGPHAVVHLTRWVWPVSRCRRHHLDVRPPGLTEHVHGSHPEVPVGRAADVAGRVRGDRADRGAGDSGGERGVQAPLDDVARRDRDRRPGDRRPLAGTRPGPRSRSG